MFIPRIGMEVLVDFIEGDPDLPVITGCVYNPDSMPAYTLPDEKTKSGIKSNSTKGGGGFNEFRLEDKKGSEQIFVHGEKDLDVRIKNDAKEIILRDRHLIVDRDQIENVKRDKHLKVVGDQNEEVGGSYSLKVTSDIQEKAQGKIALDAGTEIHLKAGMSSTIEAGTSLTLKVGGNFININSGGIFIKGSMVMINSGGAAGSGSGASPNPPKDPLEAVKAESGMTVRVAATPPPPVPKKRSPKAEVMEAASKKGTPFMRLG
jgi:type VI secretion system secreted protein VgrG